MGLTGVHLVRRWIADHGAQHDERRPGGLGLRGLDGLLEGRDVLAALDDLDVPAVRLVTLGGVLGEGDVGVVLDGDLVVVVDDDQIAEFLPARQRRRLGRHALLDVTVGGDHVDVVVERAFPLRGVRVEQPTLPAGRHGHTHGVGQPLTQRSRRGLHTRGVAVLRVAGCLRPPLTKLLDVLHLQAVAGEEQLEVQREAAVSGREDEPVPGRPLRIRGVMAHDALEQGVRHRRQAHGCAGVSAATVFDGVGRQHADRVHRAGVQIRPVGRVVPAQQWVVLRRGDLRH